MATRAQIVRAHVDAMIRADGGPLVEITFIGRDGQQHIMACVPHEAELMRSDLEFNGQPIISVQRVR